ncbi:hypothetical protein [Bosea beijingensis]|uniref:hypothetical protein n=1 Tax=Bosea beijingensis TaxID=3068632 RepID=UPI0027420502|nr:hypothetical protein [Bosea sp. REN20]
MVCFLEQLPIGIKCPGSRALAGLAGEKYGTSPLENSGPASLPWLGRAQMPSGGVEPGLLACELAAGAENTGQKNGFDHSAEMLKHKKNKVKSQIGALKLFLWCD